jgi:hypothetical protein
VRAIIMLSQQARSNPRIVGNWLVIASDLKSLIRLVLQSRPVGVIPALAIDATRITGTLSFAVVISDYT